MESKAGLNMTEQERYERLKAVRERLSESYEEMLSQVNNLYSLSEIRAKHIADLIIQIEAVSKLERAAKAIIDFEENRLSKSPFY